MRTLFKTAAMMVVLCIAFLSGIVCWLDPADDYYAFSGADMWLVRMNGPLETPNGEHIIYYSLKPDSIIVDSVQYGILIGLDRVYSDASSSYAANAAQEPGRAGTNQKIDSLRLWLIDTRTGSRREISGEITSTEPISHCEFKSSDFISSKGGWAGSCGDHDCITYDTYPIKRLIDLKDSMNSGKMPSGFSGSRTDIVFHMNSAFWQSLPGSCKLKLEITFAGGYRIEAERTVRKQ
jgi:hypothetical protein